jgi:hypothetical protein
MPMNTHHNNAKLFSNLNITVENTSSRTFISGDMSVYRSPR